MTEEQLLRLKKRELYKLIIARDSVEASAAAVEIAIKLKAGHDHPLYNSLCRDVVSSYGRPFTEMKPFGAIPSKWAKFSDKDLQATHDMLMSQRNQAVAHTDYVEGRVVIFPPYSTTPGGYTSPNVTFEVLTQFYAPNAYPHIQKLCGNLAGRLQAEIAKALTIIYGDGSTLSNPEELISADDIRALEEK